MHAANGCAATDESFTTNGAVFSRIDTASATSETATETAEGSYRSCRS